LLSEMASMAHPRLNFRKEHQCTVQTKLVRDTLVEVRALAFKLHSATWGGGAITKIEKIICSPTTNS
jgi:hypothetical protein